MVFYATDPALFLAKERAYVALRTQEGRMLSDAAVRQLPFVAPAQAFVKEWTWRRRSFQRFERYLQRRYGTQPIKILDLGCGNGWMAHRLALQTQRAVWAVDVNRVELEQGARLFAQENLRFVFADVLTDALPEQGFEVVVLAASAQYFSDLSVLVAALRGMLEPGGEIHFLDTPFYADGAAQQAAKARTAHYYQEHNAPDMAAYYHHHLWRELEAVGGQAMGAYWSALLRKAGYLAPFPWAKVPAQSK